MDDSQQDDRANQRADADPAKLRGERPVPWTPAKEGGRVGGRAGPRVVVKQRHLGDQHIPADDPPRERSQSRQQKGDDDRHERVPVPTFFSAGGQAIGRSARVRSGVDQLRDCKCGNCR